MIPNVTRGDRMGGVLRYLVGPGKRNEHTDPHLVAGSSWVMTQHQGKELDHENAALMARHLDRARKRLGVTVNGGHVWHCSLAIRADEGMLSDEKWQEIAEDFVTGMGFDDQQGTREPCRWVAVRHGVSQNGNDHIHLVVNLVRDDGTKANTWLDFKKAQTTCRALETLHGLAPLESRQLVVEQGYDPAEQQAQARERARAIYQSERREAGVIPQWQELPGDKRRAMIEEWADDRIGLKYFTAEYKAQLAWRLHRKDNNPPTWEQLPPAEKNRRIGEQISADQPRYLLALKVRAAAAGATSEDAFIRRCRADGMLIRPRFQTGGTDTVVGYSVAQKPAVGERPTWYGGGHLGRDLSLPRLRDGWGARAGTQPLEQWQAARQNRRITAGAEPAELSANQYRQIARELSKAAHQLATTPVENQAQWSHVARGVAGVYAQWSRTIEPEPGPLAHAAKALGRTASTVHREDHPATPSTVSVLSSATLVAAAGTRSPAAAQIAVIRSLMSMSRQIFLTLKESARLHEAQAIEQAVKTEVAHTGGKMIQDYKRAGGFSVEWKALDSAQELTNQDKLQLIAIENPRDPRLEGTQQDWRIAGSVAAIRQAREAREHPSTAGSGFGRDMDMDDLQQIAQDTNTQTL